MSLRSNALSLAAALAFAPSLFAESCEDWKLLAPEGLPLQALADWETIVAGFNPEDGLTHILIIEQGSLGVSRWFTWSGAVVTERILTPETGLPFPGSTTGGVRYSMCYDEANSRMLCLANDVMYQLAEEGWEQLPVHIPLTGAKAVYDRAREVVFISKGGVSYTLDGLTVTPIAPSIVPPVRLHGGLAYDETRNVVVLHGGRSGSTVLADTWEWNGAAWSLRTDILAPTPAFSFAMAWDPGRQRIVRNGGRTSTGTGIPATDETWIYPGGELWALAPATGPTGKSEHILAPHSTTGRLLLLGGSADQEGDDLWISSAPLSIPNVSSPITVRAGETATVWVHALGADLTYQWTLDHEPISGATAPALVIENVDTGDMGDYRCVVSTPCETDTSFPIPLTVLPASPIGDVDGDGDVDFADLNLLLTNYNQL